MRTMPVCVELELLGKRDRLAYFGWVNPESPPYKLFVQKYNLKNPTLRHWETLFILNPHHNRFGELVRIRQRAEATERDMERLIKHPSIRQGKIYLGGTTLQYAKLELIHEGAPMVERVLTQIGEGELKLRFQRDFP